MMRRPIARAGRPRVLGAVARTAVVALRDITVEEPAIDDIMRHIYSSPTKHSPPPRPEDPTHIHVA